MRILCISYHVSSRSCLFPFRQIACLALVDISVVFKFKFKSLLPLIEYIHFTLYRARITSTCDKTQLVTKPCKSFPIYFFLSVYLTVFFLYFFISLSPFIELGVSPQSAPFFSPARTGFYLPQPLIIKLACPSLPVNSRELSNDDDGFKVVVDCNKNLREKNNKRHIETGNGGCLI